MRVSVFLVVILTCHLSSQIAGSAVIRPHIILNALDNHGFKGALWFIETLKLFSKSFDSGDIYLFHNEINVRNEQSLDVSALSKTFLVPYSSIISNESKALRNDNLYRITLSWKYIVSIQVGQNDKSRGVVISLSFLHGSIPVATSAFGKIVDFISHNRDTDLFLLGKTQKLLSMSDWHDLAIVAFKRTSRHFSDWVQLLTNFYIRDNLYPMKQPRPAILESLAKLGLSIKIEYFTRDDVCSTAIPFESFFNAYTQTSVKQHLNAINSGNIDHQINMTIYSGHHKHLNNHRNFHKYESSRCHHLYIHNFRNSSSKMAIPAIEFYCGTTQASSVSDACIILDLHSNWKLVKRKIPESLSSLVYNHETDKKANPLLMMGHGLLRYKNATGNIPRLFCWENKANDLEHTSTYSSTNFIKVLILVSLDATSSQLDVDKYITLSKMYYARRHRYDFMVITPSEVLGYINSFQNASSSRITSILKPLMILEAMYTHLQDDWVLWTSSDVFINPKHLHLSLDAFLKDIKPDQVIAVGNTSSRSVNSVLAVRNNQKGRLLVINWLAVSMCASMTHCLEHYEHIAYASTVLTNLKTDSTSFCDALPDGTKEDRGISTNIHVLEQSDSRPNFLCHVCLSPQELSEPAFEFNNKSSNSADNFFISDAQFIFYESYLENEGCKYMERILQPCENHLRHGHLTREEHEMAMQRQGRHIIPLTDGYAFDLDLGRYCKVTNGNILEQQAKGTYMTDYEDYIKLINKIPENEWKKLYQTGRLDEAKKTFESMRAAEKRLDSC